MSKDRFEQAYQGTAPWDIPGPQPVIKLLEETGSIRGSVLDAGCGTGENALFLASRGHEVCGIDFIPLAVERASAKAVERGVDAHFQVQDALQLEDLGRTFDTVIDCGLFHTFTDEDRARYVAGLSRVLRPGGLFHLLCFSDREPPGQGPRRITTEEIRAAFQGGWTVVAIEEARFQTNDHPEARTFSVGGPRAWLATVLRNAPDLNTP